MGLLDIFKINSIKAELERLRSENQSMKQLLTHDHHEALDLTKKIENLKIESNTLDYDIIQKGHKLLEIAKDVQAKEHEFNRLYEDKKNQLLVLDDQILLESFALYQPKYDLQSSDEYKQRLDLIRDQQKAMIKKGTAATGNTDWRVNNNAAQGKKMVGDMIKLTLRAFNNECDICIANVKFNNIELCEKRIKSSFEALNKLGTIMTVAISQLYHQLKLEELYLAHEYQIKKQQEKEEQKQIREQMREEAKLQKEIEEARRSVEKEKKHYTNALEKAMKQLETCKSDEERELIQEKINELTEQLGEVEKQIKDIDYREANQRAGYVYVISNVGSFGENVYKIGMTRRLDPYDRVSELGDASVPFNFDVHAMIFSNDAPKLEATLHRTFEDRKVNAINTRREFFHVTLEEIERVIKQNHDKSVEFTRTADAEQYRETLILKEKLHAQKEIRSALLEAAPIK